jgi:hypothetical protein
MTYNISVNATLSITVYSKKQYVSRLEPLTLAIFLRDSKNTLCTALDTRTTA